MSLPVVRQALRALIDEGLLRNRQGQGTYVAAARTATLGNLRALLAEATQLIDGLQTRGARRPTQQQPDTWRARVMAAGILEQSGGEQ